MRLPAKLRCSLFVGWLYLFFAKNRRSKLFNILNIWRVLLLRKQLDVPRFVT